MPFLRKAEILPVKGQSRAVPAEFLADGYHFPQNMTFDSGELKKRPGSIALGNQTPGNQKVLHLGLFTTSELLEYLVRHGLDDIEYYDTGSDSWVNVTGVLAMDGTETDFISSAVVTEDNLYVFTTFANNIRIIRSSLANSEDLAGAAGLFKAKFVEYVTPYLVAAFLEEGGTQIPTKVRWSDTGNVEVWTDGNSGSELLTHEPSQITGMKKLGDRNYIYKSKSVYRGRKVSSSDVFVHEPVDFERGLYSGRALADKGDAHIYMGLDDFYINNDIRIQSIGAAVREFIFPRLNRDRNTTCHAIHIPSKKEVWFFITTGQEDWPTECWKYKYDLGFWYFDTVLNITTAVGFKNVNVISWDSSQGAWDDKEAAWDNVSGISNAPIPVFGRSDGFVLIEDGTIYDDKGVAYVGQLETRDFIAPVLLERTKKNFNFLQESRWLQAEYHGSGNQVKLYYSTDAGTNWVFVGTIEEIEEHNPNMFYFDVIASKIRFKFVADEIGKHFQIRSFSPYYLDQGRTDGAVAP